MKNRHTPVTLKGLLAAALVVVAAAATAPAQTASSTYRASQRDPFSKYKPPVRRKVEKKVAAKSEDDDDGDEGFKSFMKRGNKPKVDPKAGAVMVATIRRQGPQGKSQPPKGKKYG